MLKRLLSTKLLLILGLGLLTSILLWQLCLKAVIKNQLIRQARLLNAQISEPDLDVFFLGLRTLNPFNIKLSGLPLSFGPTNLDIDPGSVARLSPQGKFLSSFLEGSLNGTFNYSLSHKLLTLAFTLAQGKLYKHPQLSFLGLTSGEINITAQLRSLNQKIIDGSRFTVELTKLEMPAHKSILPVVLPILSKGILLLSLSCDDSVCKSSKLEFSSNLGEASGSVEIHMQQPAILAVKLKISLTRYGTDNLLPYFSLINPAIAENQGKPFIFSVQGPVNRPKVSVVAIEQ